MSRAFRPRRAALLALAALVVAVIALATADRATRAVYTRWLVPEPLRGAEWIWMPPPARAPDRRAFYAARVVDLDFPPAEARLAVTADEAYVFYVNGTPVGANAYGAGEAADLYRVGEQLVPGRNVLAVELRSGRLFGALVASLEVEGAGGRRLRVVTDDGWRIFRRFRPALFDPAEELDAGARVHVWGLPPVGRWGGPDGVRPLAPLDALVEMPGLEPERLRVRRGERWRRRPSLPAGGEVLLDFGEPVTGYLHLTATRPAPPVGAVYYGLSRPDPVRHRPAATPAPPLGRAEWFDAQPRTFRYALVVGWEIAEALVFAADPDRVAPLLARNRPAVGVFGLEPPRLRAPLEDEVWRRVERLEGGGGGEGD